MAGKIEGKLSLYVIRREAIQVKDYYQLERGINDATCVPEVKKGEVRALTIGLKVEFNSDNKIDSFGGVVVTKMWWYCA